MPHGKHWKYSYTDRISPNSEWPLQGIEYGRSLFVNKSAYCSVEVPLHNAYYLDTRLVFPRTRSASRKPPAIYALLCFPQHPALTRKREAFCRSHIDNTMLIRVPVQYISRRTAFAKKEMHGCCSDTSRNLCNLSPAFGMTCLFCILSGALTSQLTVLNKMPLLAKSEAKSKPLTSRLPAVDTVDTCWI